MQKNTIFTVILVAGLCSLSACGVSEAQKQKPENKAASSLEAVKNSATPTPGKNLDTGNNSFELTDEDIKKGSVKSDDYEENMNSGKSKNELCSVEAYIVDKDPNGLNVRYDAEPRARVIGKIPFNEDGIIVQITQTNFADKVKISHAETMDGDIVFDGEGWVAANLLATSTAGYNTKGVKLYEAGKGTKVLTVIPPETEVRIVSCDKDRVRVKYKKFTGWLDADSQCGNPVTNCS